MSFCLYNTNEVYNFLKHKFELPVLEKWAETHNLYFNNNSYIWKNTDIDDFLNENFELLEILEIKTANSIPINDTEKEKIVLSKSDSIKKYLGDLSSDDIIKIKKKNNVPITNEDCQNTIEQLKEDLYKNIEYENNINSRKAFTNTVENKTDVKVYKHLIKREINSFENEQTSNWAKMSTQKHKANKVLVFIFILSALFGIFECVIH